MLKFKNNLRIMQGSSFIKTKIFVYLSYSTASKLSVSLSIQYSLFCSTFALLYDEVRHQKKI